MVKKIVCVLSLFAILLTVHPGAHASIPHDTEDPMFLNKGTDFLSRTGLSFMDGTLRLSQRFTYGFTDKFSLSGYMNYQLDLDGPEDGFSNIDLGGTYRLSNGSSRVISDALFGIKFGGTERVRTPEYADTIYYAGIRIGRQWSRFTLSGTLKTSWIFDESRGMAYIDMMPEGYLRITDNWTTGLGFTIRKATNPNFDQEWVNFKLVRRYGRTQYVARLDYEVESDEYQFGTRVNVLF